MMYVQHLTQFLGQYEPSVNINYFYLLPWASSGLAFLFRLLPHPILWPQLTTCGSPNLT